MTNYVFLWEDSNGNRQWEAVEEDQKLGFLEKLLQENVHPATIMCAYNPILFHFVWKQYHNGLSDVFFGRINEQIYGTAPKPEVNRLAVDVPRTQSKAKSKFGWIAPDGRYFQCEYGGHASLASDIVGEIEYVPDAEIHLEKLGWAKIHSGACSGVPYSIGMGQGKRLTTAQITTLQREGLDHAYDIASWL